MQIALLTSSLETVYTRFVQNHAHTLLYYSLMYKRHLEKNIGCSSEYLLAMSGDEVKGVLPLMRKRGKYGDVVNSLPYYGSNGGILADSAEAVNCLIEHYNTIITKSDVAAATIIENPFLPICDQYAHDVIDTRVGQITTLAHFSIETSVESSAKRNLLKAYNSEITIEIESDFDFLYATHRSNMQAINGRAKKFSFFESIPESFVAGRDYKLYFAKKNEKNIAALLLFYFGQTVEYFTPAIVSEYRVYQPTAALIYHAIEDAKKNGYRYWNWGGTWHSQDGVYKFKRKWGAEDYLYKYYTKINNKKLLSSTPEILLEEYSDFFVVPFSMLGARF